MRAARVSSTVLKRAVTTTHFQFCPRPTVRTLKVNESIRYCSSVSLKLQRQDSEMVRLGSIELVADIDDQPERLVENLSELQAAATKERVPWFLEAMPSAYFRQVSQANRARHLVSVAAIPDMQHVPEIVSYEYFNEDTKKPKSMFIISSGTETIGKLEQQFSKIPNDARLAGLNLYTSKDSVLSITEFHFSKPEGEKNGGFDSLLQVPEHLKQYTNELLTGKFDADRKQYYNNTGEVLHATPAEYFKEENLLKFASLGARGLEDRMSPRRYCKFIEMYNTLLHRGTDEVLLDVESNWGNNKNGTMYTLALTNVLVKPTLQRICKYIESRGMIVERAHLDKIKQDAVVDDDHSIPEYNDVAFLRLLVTPMQTAYKQPGFTDEVYRNTLTELKEFLPLMSKWYDDRVINLATSGEMKLFSDANELNLTPLDYEVAVGLLDCVHLIKSRIEMYQYSKSNIESVLLRPQTYKIVDLFKQKFNPAGEAHTKSPETIKKRIDEIRHECNQHVEVEMQQKVLEKMLEIVHGAVKTNIFNKDRFAFAFKLDPSVCMDSKDVLRTETPFGVFYVNGRRFTGLHIRFREIARGGLRLVTPATKDAHTIETTRQFNECYDLAFAQQLKNKDIAEGGSKAVCLVNMEDVQHGQNRDHLIRKSLKAFVNSLLDLITANKSDNELIFLGPDEQVTIEHINWIVRRAKERSYIMPNAFMSSKPQLGINHKEFGVTSEGIQVFLDVVLKSLNMYQADSGKVFTVKITGGPDGDVAGNMLKILHREYGTRCKVVGIADGTGCVEDEVDGIDWKELLYLVKNSLPLNHIRKTNLGKNTVVTDLSTAKGVQMRNTMHNRIKADAFIPAGGRPATINESNWQKFIHKTESGEVLSSPLIVEGANLFLTSYARAKLAERGCVIIKDSSANKCGVICSAFEIISSMLLDPQEFLEIKPKLVPQVLDKLRLVARKEAELLMSEYMKIEPVARQSFNLVNVSLQVSAAINRTTDVVRATLENEILQNRDVHAVEKYLPLVKDHLPDALIKTGWHKYETKVPLKYTVNLISTLLACELVYKEGIEFVNNIKDDKVLSQIAIDYSKERRNVKVLTDKVLKGIDLTPKEAAVIARLLELGGARTAVNVGGFNKI